MLYPAIAATSIFVTTTTLLFCYCQKPKAQSQKQNALNDATPIKLDPALMKYDYSLNTLLSVLNEDVLNTEGISRIPGDANRTRYIADFMAGNNKSKPLTLKQTAKEIFTIHDVMTAFKHNFKDLPEAPFEGKTFLEVIRKSPEEQLAYIKEHLQSLINKGNIQAARIIHNLLHVGYLIQSHSDKNKMTASNVAIVFAPTFLNVCGVNNMTDMTVVTNTVKQINPVLSQCYENPLFSKPFDEKTYQKENRQAYKA